jgi:hypothetical protein
MIAALLPFAGKLLDKFVPDPQAKAQAQMELARMAQEGELAKMANDTKLFELQLQDGQSEHKEQQDTIRSGDNSTDEYVRQTRPKMARQSWYGGAAYVIGFEIAKVAGYGEGASFEMAGIVLAPALAYMGFRSFDKSKWGKK